MGKITLCPKNSFFLNSRTLRYIPYVTEIVYVTKTVCFIRGFPLSQVN